MSKYGKLSFRNGNAKLFLQETITEHDKTMDHPWMQMIYCKSFTIPQYAAWLAMEHRMFEVLEKLIEERRSSSSCLQAVYDPNLLRTPSLEVDLALYLGQSWREESRRIADASESTRKCVERMQADAAVEGDAGAQLLLAHHFQQYNAVLSGGAYLGRMVQDRMCVPHGAPGVKFYSFTGVDETKGPARVQKYLSDFDKIELDDAARERMIAAMFRVYEDAETMMTEAYNIFRGETSSYGAAKNADGTVVPPTPIPDEEQIQLTVSELHGFVGANGGRIIMSVAGELLDISAGRDTYGQGGAYALLAGRDVTRCLATMSLDLAHLDDLAWKADCDGDTKTLNNWREKLKEKYPVAGKLLLEEDGPVADAGLRQRGVAAAAVAAVDVATAVKAAKDAMPTFKVQLDKTANGRIGFDLNQDTLEIHGIAPDGLVAEWNNTLLTGDAREIRVSDQLVSVNGKSTPEEVVAELGKPQILEFTLSRKPVATVSTVAGGLAAADGSGQKCPISGKEGMACPMSMFLPAPPAQKAEPAGSSAQPNAKSGFMAGKSLIQAVEKTTVSSNTWEGTFLHKICPLHWDLATCKMVVFVAVMSWVGGFGFGWKFRGIVYG